MKVFFPCESKLLARRSILSVVAVAHIPLIYGREQAAEALEKMNGSEILGQTISVDWAFIKEEKNKPKSRR